MDNVYKTRKSFFDIAIFAEALVAVIGVIVIILSTDYRTLGIIITGVMIIAMILQAVVLASYKITIDKSRLQIKRGILSTTTEEIDLSHIASVKIHQTVLGRIAGYGDVTLDIIGKAPVLLPQIHNCQELKDVLEAKMK